MASPRKQPYFKELRFQQLRGFCEVARQRSFAGGAAALGLSRPAVWHQIRSLEREFGTSLVRRQGRGVTLTEDGRLLQELAVPLVTGFDSIKALFADRQKKVRRRLVVVTNSGLLANELKEPVKEFRHRYPMVHLSMMERTSWQAFRLVERGRADLAVAGYFADEPLNPLLEYEPLFAYPFLLVCPREHELVRRKTIRLSTLVGFPMVLMVKASVTRRRIEKILLKHDLSQKLNIVMETTNDRLLLEYVSLGLGISVAIPGSDRKIKKNLHFRSIAHWFGEETTAIVRRKGTCELPHVRGFREIVCQALAKRTGK